MRPSKSRLFSALAAAAASPAAAETAASSLLPRSAVSVSASSRLPSRRIAQDQSELDFTSISARDLPRVMGLRWTTGKKRDFVFWLPALECLRSNVKKLPPTELALSSLQVGRMLSYAKKKGHPKEDGQAFLQTAERTLRLLARQSQLRLSLFSAEDLQVLLSGCQLAGFRDLGLLDALKSLVLRRWEKMSHVERQRIFATCSAFGYKSEEFVARMASDVYEHVSVLASLPWSDVTSIASCLSALGMRDEAFFGAVADRLQATQTDTLVAQMTMSDAARLAAAFTKIYSRHQQAALIPLCRALRRQIESTLGHEQSHSGVHVQMMKGIATPSDLASLSGSLGRGNRRDLRLLSLIGEMFFTEMARNTKGHTEEEEELGYTPRDVAMILNGMMHLRKQPAPFLRDAVLEQSDALFGEGKGASGLDLFTACLAFCKWEEGGVEGCERAIVTSARTLFELLTREWCVQEIGRSIWDNRGDLLMQGQRGTTGSGYGERERDEGLLKGLGGRQLIFLLHALSKRAKAEAERGTTITMLKDGGRGEVGVYRNTGTHQGALAEMLPSAAGLLREAIEACYSPLEYFLQSGNGWRSPASIYHKEGQGTERGARRQHAFEAEPSLDRLRVWDLTVLLSTLTSPAVQSICWRDKGGTRKVVQRIIERTLSILETRLEESTGRQVDVRDGVGLSGTARSPLRKGNAKGDGETSALRELETVQSESDTVDIFEEVQGEEGERGGERSKMETAFGGAGGGRHDWKREGWHPTDVTWVIRSLSGGASDSETAARVLNGAVRALTVRHRHFQRPLFLHAAACALSTMQSSAQADLSTPLEERESERGVGPREGGLKFEGLALGNRRSLLRCFDKCLSRWVATLDESAEILFGSAGREDGRSLSSFGTLTDDVESTDEAKGGDGRQQEGGGGGPSESGAASVGQNPPGAAGRLPSLTAPELILSEIRDSASIIANTALSIESEESKSSAREEDWSSRSLSGDVHLSFYVPPLTQMFLMRLRLIERARQASGRERQSDDFFSKIRKKIRKRGGERGAVHDASSNAEVREDEEEREDGEVGERQSAETAAEVLRASAIWGERDERLMATGQLLSLRSALSPAPPSRSEESASSASERPVTPSLPVPLSFQKCLEGVHRGEVAAPALVPLLTSVFRSLAQLGALDTPFPSLSPQSAEDSVCTEEKGVGGSALDDILRYPCPLAGTLSPLRTLLVKTLPEDPVAFRAVEEKAVAAAGTRAVARAWSDLLFALSLVRAGAGGGQSWDLRLGLRAALHSSQMDAMVGDTLLRRGDLGLSLAAFWLLEGRERFSSILSDEVFSMGERGAIALQSLLQLLDTTHAGQEIVRGTQSVPELALPWGHQREREDEKRTQREILQDLEELMQTVGTGSGSGSGCGPGGPTEAASACTTTNRLGKTAPTSMPFACNTRGCLLIL